MQSQELTTTDIEKEGEDIKIVNLNIDPNRPKYGNMIVLINSKYMKLNLGPDCTYLII